MSVTASLTTRPVSVPRPGEGVQHRIAQAALDPVVLDDHEQADVIGGGAQRVRVDRFHAVAVEHASRDAVGREAIGGAQGLVQRDAGADQRDVGAVTEGLGAADGELLAVGVERRGRLSRGPDVGDPGKIGHACDEPDRRVPVGRVQHGGAVDRAERGQVLQRHLGGAVLADRHARVRTAQAEVGAADRRHADLVVRAGQERSEGRREGGLAERLHPGLHADHRLLGDVHLEEALGRDRLDVFRVRGVADLAVEDDEVGAFSGEPGQRLAERLARGDRLRVGGRGRAGRRARARPASTDRAWAG